VANPWEFLDIWAREYVQATVYDDKGTAGRLALECREAAKAAGVNEHAVVKAAGGNLEDFMLGRLNEAVNAEAQRLVDKDKR